MIQEYKKDNLMVMWDDKVCIHSAVCAKGLPHVFKPKEKRWIQTENAHQEEIIAQIKKCPSGALSFKLD